MKEKVNVNLVVPRNDYRKLKMMSIQEGTTVPELLREATRMSFFVRAISQDPDTRLLVERGGEVKEIIFTGGAFLCPPQHLGTKRSPFHDQSGGVFIRDMVNDEYRVEASAGDVILTTGGGLDFDTIFSPHITFNSSLTSLMRLAQTVAPTMFSVTHYIIL